MTDQKDGGAAFPRNHDPYPNCQGTTRPSRDNGMSLRDWLAGQVLAGHAMTVHSMQPHARTAAKAYAIADAMLAERSKP